MAASGLIERRSTDVLVLTEDDGTLSLHGSNTLRWERFWTINLVIA